MKYIAFGLVVFGCTTGYVKPKTGTAAVGNER
jgi:hypothetical protein